MLYCIINNSQEGEPTLNISAVGSFSHEEIITGESQIYLFGITNFIFKWEAAGPQVSLRSILQKQWSVIPFHSALLLPYDQFLIVLL